MNQPSFLARKTWGLSHYFLLAMAAAFVIAFMPRGVRFAIQSNTNKAEDWLPDSYDESKDLRWFRDYFIGEQFVLVSWDGCTLGDTEKLNLLARKLVPSQQSLASADPDSATATRASPISFHAFSMPRAVRQRTSPSNLLISSVIIFRSRTS